MNKNVVSDAVKRRLPRYYRFLSVLQEEKVERISSEELSKRMGVTASQIRQDLNNFGGFGQQGYGYNVDKLKSELGRILGLDTAHNIIIIGAGNLGQALANYSNFQTRGLIVKGIFDIREDLIGKKAGDLTVMPMEALEDFIKENNISIATLAIPKEPAPTVAAMLYSYGIRAFWNFAHVDLDLPEDAVSENVHLSDSLMQLTYWLNNG
ncbi:MAG: redox-sensing transcriptional repressor Rex [Lachnospiraceae bacterium]|nr:redox-sensing transcriptional repressor Rex [Lachnospiraceae bacterium]